MKVESKAQRASQMFMSGSNCAQAVLSVFASEKGYTLDQAHQIASGFGAGMGRLQETCGAVTGAYMALGLFLPKDDVYASVQSFSKNFESKHKTTNCKELLNCDLLTESGQEFFKSNNLRENTCNKCVISAVEILEKMLSK